MPVIRVNLAARLRVVVERTGDVPALRHRQGDEVVERRDCVGEAGEEILVRCLGDVRVGRCRRDERVDRVLDQLLLGLRLGRLPGRRCFEVGRPAVNLAVERQADRPHRRLHEHRQHLGIGERAFRRLDHDFVVTVEDGRPAACLGAQQSRSEKIARDPLHRVLKERAVPRSHALPLALGIVEELDIGLAVLELGVGHEPRARIMDCATAREGHCQGVAVERDDQRRLRGLPATKIGRFCPMRIATRIARANSRPSLRVAGCAVRHRFTSACSTSSLRPSSPTMRRSAPTDPP